MKEDRRNRGKPRRASGHCLGWSVIVAASLALAMPGCGTTGATAAKPGSPVEMLPFGIGEKAKHEALRKKVEADSFPTAAEAGL